MRLGWPYLRLPFAHVRTKLYAEDSRSCTLCFDTVGYLKLPTLQLTQPLDHLDRIFGHDVFVRNLLHLLPSRHSYATARAVSHREISTPSPEGRLQSASPSSLLSDASLGRDHVHSASKSMFWCGMFWTLLTPSPWTLTYPNPKLETLFPNPAMEQVAAFLEDFGRGRRRNKESKHGGPAGRRVTNFTCQISTDNPCPPGLCGFKGGCNLLLIARAD